MTNKHHCIKFTSEIEKNNSFSFLDIQIHCENNHFTTSVYNKPTFSGVYTHFESFIDHSYKKLLIVTLLFQSFSICSDFQKFHTEVEKLRDIFKRKGYPSGLIEQCIRMFFHKLYVPKKVHLTIPNKELVIILPFLGKFSSNLK